MSQQNMKQLIQDGGSRYLSFYLGADEFAIPLLAVKEVIAVPELRPMPFSPAHFLGIMNLRGDIIPVVDLRRKLEIKPLERSLENAVIICDLGPQNLGIKVDCINSVVAPNASDLSANPNAPGGRLREFIYAVFKRDKDLVLLLDITKVLDSVDQESIKRSSDIIHAA